MFIFIKCGRPHGGLCFLWMRSLDPFIEPLIYVDEKRLLGLKITSSNATILLLNVYLPHQTDYNADEYLEILGKIQAISDSFESTNIFIIGDFNADIKNPSLFTPFLNAFINDCHLIASDTLLLPSDAFTYVSDAHGSRSWLDHVLTTHSSHSSISDMTVYLPTTYLYAFLYMSSYYLPLKPPYRSKFTHLILCGMLPPPRISITIIHKPVCFYLLLMYLMRF